jgi:hypothetical protein
MEDPVLFFGSRDTYMAEFDAPNKEDVLSRGIRLHGRLTRY